MRMAGIFAVGALLATAPALAEPPLARVLLKNGMLGEIGGSAAIIGTNAAEDVTLRDEPGRIEFDASFNRGNDTIRLPGDAASYTVRQAGSQVLLAHDSRTYSIPVGAAGMPIVFADGTRRLAFGQDGGMFVGSQRVTEATVRLTAPAS